MSQTNATQFGPHRSNNRSCANAQAHVHSRPKLQINCSYLQLTLTAFPYQTTRLQLLTTRSHKTLGFKVADNVTTPSELLSFRPLPIAHRPFFPCSFRANTLVYKKTHSCAPPSPNPRGIAQSAFCPANPTFSTVYISATVSPHRSADSPVRRFVPFRVFRGSTLPNLEHSTFNLQNARRRAATHCNNQL
jgi:hypothetical protein